MTDNPPVPHPSEKPALRRLLSERRAAFCTQHPEAPRALSTNFLKHIPLTDQSVIAGYVARQNEMDVMPLLAALSKLGHPLTLPAVIGRGTSLVFRHYKPGDVLVPGMLGVPEPMVTAATTEPDVVLVPLLGFDRQRSRLGTGGGYYDRTLAALHKNRRILAVGIGFSCQELPALPVEPHDIRLDRIVTEIQVF